MEKYVIIKIGYDGEYLSHDEVREMVEENMLQYADGAPFDISIEGIIDTLPAALGSRLHS